MSYRDGKVNKRQIQSVIDNLEMLLDEMEANNVEEVGTESNTYFCNGHGFISFTGLGFLKLEEDYTDLVEAEINDEEE